MSNDWKVKSSLSTARVYSFQNESVVVDNESLVGMVTLKENIVVTVGNRRVIINPELKEIEIKFHA